MELKEYQASALDAFARWREAVERARLDSEAAVAALQGVRLPCLTKCTWRGRQWYNDGYEAVVGRKALAAPPRHGGAFRDFRRHDVADLVCGAGAVARAASWRVAGSLVDLGTVLYTMAAVAVERGIRTMFWALEQHQKWRAQIRAEGQAEGRAEGRAQGQAEGRAQAEAATARRYEDWLAKVAKERGIDLAELLPPADTWEGGSGTMMGGIFVATLPGDTAWARGEYVSRTPKDGANIREAIAWPGNGLAANRNMELLDLYAVAGGSGEGAAEAAVAALQGSGWTFPMARRPGMLQNAGRRGCQRTAEPARAG